MDEVMQLMLQAHEWEAAAASRDSVGGGQEDPDVQVSE